LLRGARILRQLPLPVQDDRCSLLGEGFQVERAGDTRRLDLPVEMFQASPASVDRGLDVPYFAGRTRSPELEEPPS